MRFQPIKHADTLLRLSFNLTFLGHLAAKSLPFYGRVSQNSFVDFVNRVEDEYDLHHPLGSVASARDIDDLFTAIDQWLPYR
jgi:hypothetical protein